MSVVARAPLKGSREQRVVEVQSLRAEGLTIREIADRTGLSMGSVNTYLCDPDLSKQRARRERYQGRCADCGGPTDGSGGYGKHPERCAQCRSEHVHFEACDRIVSAIKEFAARYGRPPGAVDWNPRHAIVLGHPEKAVRFREDRCWPYASAVQRVFGSWNAAIAAAGFAPTPVGHRGPQPPQVSS